MTATVGIFVKVISVFMTALLMFMPGIPVGEVSYSAEDAESIQLNVAVLSDVHMESYTLGRFAKFRDALKDINASETKNDALVLLGDNTMNGQITEYFMLYSLLSAYNKIDNTLLVMGNHDINQSSNTIDEAVAKHNAFYNAYTGSQNDKPYYYREINGYYLIVMGSEDEKAGTSSVISEEQLEWLDETLALAAESGNPIFLFHHQPFPYMKGNSTDVFNVVKQYDNVIFFSGHMHSLVSVNESSGVTLVNLPHFYDEEGDNDVSGMGMQIEAYEDHVLLSMRSYAKGQWVNERVYTIELD